MVSFVFQCLKQEIWDFSRFLIFDILGVQLMVAYLSLRVKHVQLIVLFSCALYSFHSL